MLGNAPVIAIAPCVDLERAKRFYGETLGLREAEMPGSPEDAAMWSVLYECGGGTRLLVYQRDTPTKAEHTAAGWLVEDLEAVADQLNARGVQFEVYDLPGATFDDRGIATAGDTKTAWFKDPEGNILSIAQAP